MFCPVCKAEYRQGFARCADCDVELVWELPANAIVANEPVDPGDPDEDPFCSFWEETPGVEGLRDSTGPNDYTDSGGTEDDENWNGEEAVAEIWSGNEPELAEFIAASLQINQIQFRHDRSGGKHTLYVLVEEETRAREIVREVVEGVHLSETRLTLGCLPDISSAPIRDGDGLNSFSSLRLDVSLAPERGYALLAWRDTWLRLLDRKAR